MRPVSSRLTLSSLTLGSLTLSSLMLAACGGTTGTDTQPSPVDYSQLQVTPQSEASLTRVSATTLERHIKNGLRLQLQGRYLGIGGGTALPSPEAGAPEAVADGNTDSRSGGFSETNVHVQGVDEADYAKYDGRHWFIAIYPQYGLPQKPTETQPPAGPGIQIVATDPAVPDAEIVGHFTFDDSARENSTPNSNWGTVGQMYLVQQDGVTTHLAAVRHQRGNVLPILPGLAPDMAIDLPAAPGLGGIANDALIWPGPVNSKVQIQGVDVRDPGAPAADWRLELDGSLINSRKIGNTLYLITRYDPWLNGIQYDIGGQRHRASNEERLDQATLTDLLPHYTLDGQRLPLSTHCHLQQDIQPHHGFATLIHITAIDLTRPDRITSQCINSNVGALSMSTRALYLAGHLTDTGARSTTVIHKFALASSGPAYAASGKVQGSLGGNSDPAFRMHEHEDQFRIVTTEWHSGIRPVPNDRDTTTVPVAVGPEHRLTILHQQGNRLLPLAQLPNERHPAPIGKPGEDIYSVRFNKDRAYIVTFLRTDPLYAIDLSDPANPVIAGELEVPGFATYMHPVGDDYLFTFGQHADERGTVLGLKAELINISDGTPRVHTTLHFGDAQSYSEALRNLRALSFLPVGDDSLRIAIPMTLYTRPSDRHAPQWQYTGLQLLEVNGFSGDRAWLADAGVLVGARGDASPQAYPRSGLERSILHGDAVFYTYNNGVWAARWDDPTSATGPIFATDP